MGLNDSLKCPGLDITLSVIPVDVDCPQCNEIVEIWSDEFKRRCARCGTVVFNPNPLVRMPKEEPSVLNQMTLQDKLDELIELAISFGSSAATIVDTEKILVENYLAKICLETKCQNYGLSPTCPPNVEGPEWLKEYIKKTSHAILIEIETPLDVMYSDKRREIGKLLHFIVIQLEQAAHGAGFLNSKAFAGGSCKNLLCSDHPYCNVLGGDGVCRNPDLSRPSVSGYGININHLLKISGWSQGSGDVDNPTSSRYGIVILG